MRGIHTLAASLQCKIGVCHLRLVKEYEAAEDGPLLSEMMLAALRQHLVEKICSAVGTLRSVPERERPISKRCMLEAVSQ